MAETEVFRLTPGLNKCYEHAEYSRGQGNYPNERYFVNVPPRYVGEFIRFEQGGWGDGGWRRDYFRDLNGNEIAVNYSYEGRTCFREVPCGPKPLPREHLEAIETRNHIPTLKSLAFAKLPTKTVSDLRQNYYGILGGKTLKRNRKSKARKSKRTSRKLKRRSSRKKNIK
uniref:Uncharacterized protein n=1 Tax=viral metagenome TaxID=1070528 RepID=A0A6C0K1D0_9ZZZZ